MQITKIYIAALSLAVIAALTVFDAQEAFAFFGGKFGTDPFEKGNKWMMDMGKRVSLLVTGGAFLAGMIVICMAMAGRLRADWAGRICGGLIGMTGLTWIIESIIG